MPRDMRLNRHSAHPAEDTSGTGSNSQCNHLLSEADSGFPNRIIKSHGGHRSPCVRGQQLPPFGSLAAPSADLPDFGARVSRSPLQLINAHDLLRAASAGRYESVAYPRGIVREISNSNRPLSSSSGVSFPSSPLLRHAIARRNFQEELWSEFH